MVVGAGGRGYDGHTVVFDLDGTLLDTAPDLISAVNQTLALAGGTPVRADILRPVVSFGGREMIRTGLDRSGLDTSDQAVDALFQSFLEHYGGHFAIETVPFPGLFDALDGLLEGGAGLAVCTNKIEALTWPLLEAFDLAARFSAVTGRDTFPVCKPDPRHLLGTIAKAGGDPTRAVMIGDSNTDVQTAKAAGIPVVGVTFGYTDVPITDLGCNAVVSHYGDLLEVVAELIGQNN